MPGDAPKMIITDQDPAMTKAFPIVLPNTFHRYCSWHILMKFSQKIDAVKYSKYKDEFSDCIWNSKTPEEFDLQWESLIKKIDLGGNKCLDDIYKIRPRWIPAYVNTVFFSGMSSSQRAESGHAFFKRFVSKGNSLVNFMIQYGRGLFQQRHEELVANHKDQIEKPKIRIKQNFLEQMVNVYTNSIYYKFESEMSYNLDYKIQLIKETDTHRAYQIQRKKNEACNVQASKVRELIHDKKLDFVSCVCKKFESVGIPCKHIITYLMRFDDNGFLPEKYILKRWTKSLKISMVVDDKRVHIGEDKSFALIRSQLMQSSLDVVDKALAYEETRKIYLDGLSSISEKIDQFLGSTNGSNLTSNDPIQIGDSVYYSEKNYNEPDLASKGVREKA